METTGTKGYIVHLSCEAALKEAIAAKAKGIDISIESVIPHFIMDKTYAERPNHEGAKFAAMSPPTA